MTTHYAVVDLGYGDAGKGSLVDRICANQKVNAVIRFNGGCQAAHNVITDDGTHHTFAQFGSGTLQGVPTVLSQHMLVEPFSLDNEARALKKIGITDPYYNLSVDGRALVTTPYHWIVNRYKEDQRSVKHGSCGRGIGETVSYADEYRAVAPEVWDLFDQGRLLEMKLTSLHTWALDRTKGTVDLPPVASLLERYRDLMRHGGIRDVIWEDDYEEVLQDTCVFEGAQGVLLDETYGFQPHTTWSTTTDKNAREIVSANGDDLHVIGITRSYSTRHGAGPFVPEDNSLNLPEAHNGFGQYQGGWRVGHLDLPALRYAVSVCERVDSVYVTHMDALDTELDLAVCDTYKDYAGKHWYTAAGIGTPELYTMAPDLVEHPGDYRDIAVLLDSVGSGYSVGPKTSDGRLYLDQLVH